MSTSGNIFKSAEASVAISIAHAELREAPAVASRRGRQRVSRGEPIYTFWAAIDSGESCCPVAYRPPAFTCQRPQNRIQHQLRFPVAIWGG